MSAFAVPCTQGNPQPSPTEASPGALPSLLQCMSPHPRGSPQ
eukprot:CAMPEP_0118969278 /NCGR_PEP_ID=MMETSP1173-20130426/6391_1 /TAXON_ID=1034831 /ORGANISM="Rhizochromulina marina cf, Strain CCMP1243" /LENGTH=41 /DNA_ID= /DNA_START= /DNA_END= /DNA_ORIENTATION=